VIEGNVFWTFSMEAFSKSRAPELMLADASDHIEADEKFQELCVEGHFKGQSAESYNSFLNSFKK
ncbi:MAG: hypothetical protein R3345_15810, partial [Fulvivirga sp.]|nr:hypothetical protein [Fulvivirga sp.]